MTEIVVPRLGWSMDEGTFGEWLKKDGEWVKSGDMLFVLEGEKAAQEIESFDEGVLHIPSGAPKPGDTVLVGQLLAFLLEKGETPPTEVVHQEQQVAEEKQDEASALAGPALRRLARELGVQLSDVKGTGTKGRVTEADIRNSATKCATGSASVGPTSTTTHFPKKRTAITPRARRIARELGVDSSQLSGTGRNGRVRERDIRAALQRNGNKITAGRLLEVPKIRRTIATRMLASVQQTAPVTLTTKVDATGLVQLRNEFKTASEGSAPSYNDMLVKLVAEALPQCNLLNACWRDDGIYVYDQVNIAVAVDTPIGLLAPVINNVQYLSLREVADKSRELVEQVRNRKLTDDQLIGGTFTISNLGMYDIDHFTPIINLPQTAILGVGRIVREPAVVDDEIVPRDMMGLSLTFDHRVVDGAPAAKWLQQLSRMIESPSSWLSN